MDLSRFNNLFEFLRASFQGSDFISLAYGCWFDSTNKMDVALKEKYAFWDGVIA